MCTTVYMRVGVFLSVRNVENVSKPPVIALW